ncbi:unnamed protein product, partial [Musa acuminata subsp. malaccensis]
SSFRRFNKRNPGPPHFHSPPSSSFRAFSMLKLWRWYQKCLAVHPVKTQIVSSGFLWGLGDIGAQAVTQRTLRHQSQDRKFEHIWYILQEENKEINIDWRRVATTSMFGFAFVGPVGHYWSRPSKCTWTMLVCVIFFLTSAISFLGLCRYEYLDRIIRVRLQLQPKSMKFVTTKVVADGLIFGPLDLLIFFSYMGLASGRSISQVKEDVKRDFLPALIVGGTVWPIVQVANFRFVPVRYQLLYVNLFCLLDSSFLSWIEQQGDAPWKQWFTSFRSLENKKSQS